MKKKIVKFGFIFSAFLMFIVLISASLDWESSMYQGLSEDSKLLYRFINQEGKTLEKKYAMRQCGNGLSGMDKISVMALSFEREGDAINEEEARKLIVNCAEDFLVAINQNNSLKFLLKNYPFTGKNLNLTIFNYDKKHVLHHFPSIGVIKLSRNEIGYFTKIPTKKYGYHTEKYETYEEAVTILKNEK